jgi:hypothetical protein
MHSTAQRRVDLRGISEPPLEVTVEFDIRRGGWQPAPVSPLAILASHGRVGSQRALKAANALEGAIGTYGCAVALNQIGCRALSRMGRLDDYRRFAKECLDMANAVQDATSRASLLQMAQVWLRLAQAHDAKRHSDQGCE